MAFTIVENCFFFQRVGGKVVLNYVKIRPSISMEIWRLHVYKGVAIHCVNEI
jgi:hypothetical protein